MGRRREGRVNEDLLKRVFSAPGFDEELEAKLEQASDCEDSWSEAFKVIKNSAAIEGES